MSSILEAIPSDLLPAYVYDLDEVRAAAVELRKALPPATTLVYSLKANPHPAIVGTLAENSLWAEVSSIGELSIALKAGVRPTRILHSGPGKQDSEVRAAVMAGVEMFSVDSVSGLQQVELESERAGVDAQCLLRLNPAVATAGHGLVMSGRASSLGLDTEEVRRCPPHTWSHLHGFHVYLGSNVADEDSLVCQFQQSLTAIQRVQDIVGIESKFIDLGGGFGAPYARAGNRPHFAGLAERLAGLLDQSFPDWKSGRPQVAFESGRFLTATAGTLVTRVADIKNSHGTRVLVLESGINHLGGMAGLRRVPPITPAIQGPNAELRGDPVLIAGPLCTPLDRLHSGTRMALLARGDVITIPNVGAYGLTASLLAFLGRPAPAEIIVSGNQITDVSRLVIARESLNRETEGG